MTDKDFSQKYRDKSGGMNQITNSAYIEKSGRSRLALYKTIFHEAIHIASFRKYHADAEQRIFQSYRTGYNTQHTREENHEHFRGLNEAVVDKTVMDILRKHQEELIRESKPHSGRRPTADVLRHCLGEGLRIIQCSSVSGNPKLDRAGWFPPSGSLSRKI